MTWNERVLAALRGFETQLLLGVGHLGQWMLFRVLLLCERTASTWLEVLPNVTPSALMGAAALTGSGVAFSRWVSPWASAASWTAANGFLAVNYLCIHSMRVPFSWALLAEEAEGQYLRSSIASELTAAGTTLTIVALALPALLAFRERRRRAGSPLPVPSPAPPRFAYGSVALWVALVGWAAGRGGQRGYDTYVLWSLASKSGAQEASPSGKRALGENEDARAARSRAVHAVAPLSPEAKAWRSVSSSDRPNIVLFVLESTGALQVAPEGHVRPEFPTLRALEASGLFFPRIYATAPATIRSSLSLMTGGEATTADRVCKEFREKYSGRSMARTFAKGGYRTALFSAANLPFGNLRVVVDGAGYERVFDFEEQSADYKKSAQLTSWGGRDDVVWEDALRWAETSVAEGRPFFLHFVTNASHHPYTVPAPFDTTAPGARPEKKYAQAIRYLDQVVGKAREALREKSPGRPTLFAITGDHGEAFEEWHHGNRFHRNALFEENSRSFLLVGSTQPDAAPAAEVPRVGTVEDIHDVLACLSGLTDCQATAAMGMSLLADAPQARLAFSYKAMAPRQVAVIDGDWKLIQSTSGDPAALYDLKADPREQTDVKAQHATVVARLRAAGLEWLSLTAAQRARHCNEAEK
jgi:arylsulfatase A-like enzyme